MLKTDNTFNLLTHTFFLTSYYMIKIVNVQCILKKVGASDLVSNIFSLYKTTKD